MLSYFPKEKFDRLVKKYGSDKHSKGISSWTHLVTMLFCHIVGACSVRDISQGLRSTTGNINHLGIGRVPCKSSLSYIKNTAAMNFSGIFIIRCWENYGSSTLLPAMVLKN